MGRTLRAFYNKNWCSRVFIGGRRDARRDKHAAARREWLFEKPSALWPTASPPHSLPPATGAGPLARQSRRRCRLFGVRAGAPGDSVSRRGDQYSWRYRRPWLTILSQDEYFKNLSPSSSSFSSSRRYFLRREPIGGGGEGLLSNILHLDSRIRVHFLGRPY